MLDNFILKLIHLCMLVAYRQQCVQIQVCKLQFLLSIWHKSNQVSLSFASLHCCYFTARVDVTEPALLLAPFYKDCNLNHICEFCQPGPLAKLGYFGTRLACFDDAG